MNPFAFLAPIFSPTVTYLSELISHSLIQLTVMTGSLGASIVLFTVVLRTILLPLTIPSIKAQKKIRDVKPELDELKKKHKGDKQAQQAAQMELYRKYNINPLSGCLPQLVQIAILIILYRTLLSFLGQSEVEGVVLQTQFLWFNLAQPDNTYVLPVLAGVFQFIMSLMILPGGEVKDVVPNTSSDKAVQKENEKEEDVAEMAASMQQQMVFMLPMVTVFAATRFPSGLALYWVITTVFSIGQQYVLSGPGGLVTYFQRAKAWFGGKTLEMEVPASQKMSQTSSSQNQELTAALKKTSTPKKSKKTKKRKAKKKKK